MIEIVNKFLLGGDKFMPEMNLREPGFTYSTCGPFTKKKKRIPKFKGTGDWRYIYQNQLGKACFQHDVAYRYFKDTTRRTTSDKILRDKSFNIAKNPKYHGYETGIASMVYQCFDKATSGSGIKNENISKKEAAEELHKPIIRKFNKRKVHPSFLDNIWGDDLADMQLVSKFNKRIRFLLHVVDIFSKYAWVMSFKDKKKYYNKQHFPKKFKRIK